MLLQTVASYVKVRPPTGLIFAAAYQRCVPSISVLRNARASVCFCKSAFLFRINLRTLNRGSWENRESVSANPTFFSRTFPTNDTNAKTRTPVTQCPRLGFVSCNKRQRSCGSTRLRPAFLPARVPLAACQPVLDYALCYSLPGLRRVAPCRQPTKSKLPRPSSIQVLGSGTTITLPLVKAPPSLAIKMLRSRS